MTRAAASDIDDLLSALRADFPDAEVLATLSEAGAIDDVPKEVIAPLAEMVRRLPATAKLLPEEHGEKLRGTLRQQLLNLRTIDDNAEARAAKWSQQKAALAETHAQLEAAGQALRDQLAEQRRDATARGAERDAAGAQRRAELDGNQRVRAAAKAARDAAREERHAARDVAKAERETQARERKTASAAAKAQRDSAREERERKLADDQARRRAELDRLQAERTARRKAGSD